jgi:Holliday junction resolvase
MMNKKPVATKKGTRVEKLCADELKAEGYLVWKTIRVRYQNIDLFGLFDVVALHPDGVELLLIQCKSTRCDNETRRKVARLKIPFGVKKQIWIRKHGFWIKEVY